MKKTAVRLIAIASCAAAVAMAQAPAIKRMILQRIDVTPDREAVLGLAEISAGE